MSQEPLRVLFLCTGNSARSQMAEALLTEMTHGRIAVFSAGSHPRSEIHPFARQIMKDVYGLEMRGQRPKPLEDFLVEPFDYVITVCDRAAESCPTFTGAPEVIQWSFEDPAAVEGSAEEKLRAFQNTAKDLAGRIRLWLSLPKIAERARGSGVGHAV